MAGGNDRDRRDWFAQQAARLGDGAQWTAPSQLKGEARRQYVRATLREDHTFRIRNRPEGAQAKFDKLADEPFSFFRGTALLFYRDLIGTDLELPIVFTIGDIHPENFGVMPNADGAPIFGVNDFDEAWFAPFSYDLKRGATGFHLAALRNGWSKSTAKELVGAWVDGYLAGLTAFARDDRERWHQWRLDNSPPLLAGLLEEAITPRREFLADKIDFETEQFLATDEIVPYSSHVAELQAVVDSYRPTCRIEDPAEGYFTVKDAAIKTGSGTASLGLDRFWVLLQGPDEDPTTDLVLELKQARPSALTGLIPEDLLPHELFPESEGERPTAAAIVRAQRVHLVGGDPHYGYGQWDGASFLIRERSPLKHDFDLEDLDEDELRTYAAICGETLAQTHARSDEDTGVMRGDAEARILAAVDRDLFRADVVRFAKRAAKRVKKDWQRFREDHELGAFEFVHSDADEEA